MVILLLLLYTYIYLYLHIVQGLDSGRIKLTPYSNSVPTYLAKATLTTLQYNIRYILYYLHHIYNIKY